MTKGCVDVRLGDQASVDGFRQAAERVATLHIQPCHERESGCLHRVGRVVMVARNVAHRATVADYCSRAPAPVVPRLLGEQIEVTHERHAIQCRVGRHHSSYVGRLLLHQPAPHRRERVVHVASGHLSVEAKATILGPVVHRVVLDCRCDLDLLRMVLVQSCR